MTTLKQKLEMINSLSDDLNTWTTDQLIDYLTISEKMLNQFGDKFGQSAEETRWDVCEILRVRSKK